MRMPITTPIADFVCGYAAEGGVRAHMPGHKGSGPLGIEALDITEIKGADELYEAEGIIAESEANAARLFGTAQTFYSAEGSSLAIRAMLYLALQAAPRGKRPVLLAARNAHKALVYAAALLDFDIAWLWPQGGALCSCPVTPEGLQQALDEQQGTGALPFAVYVTSPDYLGEVQDVAALAAVCTRYGVPLLVDNAHGAYLPFVPGGSRHPIALGAAMCCDSAHKTLPVLTGGAYLHLGPNAPVQDVGAVRRALNLFGSTSPSYLILQSLDLCNAALAGQWPAELAVCLDRLAALRRTLNEHFSASFAIDGPGREPLKLTLDAYAIGWQGRALADALRVSHIECEYADPRFIVLMFTPANPPEDYARVTDALCALTVGEGSFDTQAEADDFAALRRETVQACTIREAVLGAQEAVPAAAALGRVCALPTVSCPPAVPVVVCGERIGPAAVRLLGRYGVENVAVLTE